MYDESETIQEFERDGFDVRVSISPDYDYRPGEDDDVYPRLTYWEGGELDVRDEWTGQFVRRPLGPFSGTVQGEYYVVEPDDVDRLITLMGGSPRAARKWIDQTAAAIACRDLSWINVDVTVSRAGVELGRASLGGVDYDVRDAAHQKASDEYARNIPTEYDLIGEALDEAKQAATVIGEAVR